MNTDLRYPVGRFEKPSSATADQCRVWIDEIAEAPRQLRAVASGLTEAQLDTPYRPGGWTARQVVHHVADSHLNAYIRTKWTLTEDEPAIKVYEQDDWAALPEARSGPIDLSLDLLDALHARWVAGLRALDDDAFERALDHPESGRLTLAQLLALYAWHGRHHTAHIARLREREGW